MRSSPIWNACTVRGYNVYLLRKPDSKSRGEQADDTDSRCFVSGPLRFSNVDFFRNPAVLWKILVQNKKKKLITRFITFSNAMSGHFFRKAVRKGGGMINVSTKEVGREQRKKHW